MLSPTNRSGGRSARARPPFRTSPLTRCSSTRPPVACLHPRALRHASWVPGIQPTLRVCVHKCLYFRCDCTHCNSSSARSPPRRFRDRSRSTLTLALLNFTSTLSSVEVSSFETVSIKFPKFASGRVSFLVIVYSLMRRTQVRRRLVARVANMQITLPHRRHLLSRDRPPENDP